MSFTNENLNHFKELLAHEAIAHPNRCRFLDELFKLTNSSLSRLEAAEKVCEQMSNWSNLAEDDREILEAWRKECGL